MKSFLPMTLAEMKKAGVEQFDFICLTGDAYVDHPSFGFAIITRVIEALGYNVGIIAAPNMKSDTDFIKFGAPKYGFFVTSGNVDSMVSNYTVAKRRRAQDDYQAGGKAGKRPDYACTAYCKKLKELYPKVPIVIGGLEASLRRFAHYDYWSDSVMPSILVSSGADILTYGMGENQTREVANRLASGENPRDIVNVKGTCVLVKVENSDRSKYLFCPSYDDVVSSKRKYAQSVKIQYEEQDAVSGKAIYQEQGEYVLKQNPPMPPLTREEFDEVYALDYMRDYHPSYKNAGGVPAIEEVKFSIIHNRGCFGYCNFCAIGMHQGRSVVSRSKESIVEEAREITNEPDFKGYIHDIGGPTANFRYSACAKQATAGCCKDKRCLAPTPCKALRVDHSEYLDILKTVRELPKVKKVFIRSGIRFDYLMLDDDNEFFRELVKNHISGQLKVAPEHTSDSVLRIMGKPPIKVFNEFKEKYEKFNREYKKEQYLVPYLMSSHPGSTLNDAISLAQYLKKNKLTPEQVQDFYPTPGTISTCMFYTGIDPISGKHIYVPKSDEEKQMQRALLQYNRPQNAAIVRKALFKAGRGDLVGFGQNCLVHPSKTMIQTKNNQKRDDTRGRVKKTRKTPKHR